MPSQTEDRLHPVGDAGFARNLQAQGLKVDYVKLPDNTGSLTGEVDRAVRRHRVAKVVVTQPGEWRVLEAMQAWHRLLGVPVEIRQDDRFFATKDLFARWACMRRSNNPSLKRPGNPVAPE